MKHRLAVPPSSEPGLGFARGLRVLDDWRGVVAADPRARFLLQRRAHRPRLMNPDRRHAGQLRHPAADEYAVCCGAFSPTG